MIIYRVAQVDPHLSCTVVVSTKLDTRPDTRLTKCTRQATTSVSLRGAGGPHLSRTVAASTKLDARLTKCTHSPKYLCVSARRRWTRTCRARWWSARSWTRTCRNYTIGIYECVPAQRRWTRTCRARWWSARSWTRACRSSRAGTTWSCSCARRGACSSRACSAAAPSSRALTLTITLNLTSRAGTAWSCSCARRGACSSRACSAAAPSSRARTLLCSNSSDDQWNADKNLGGSRRVSARGVSRTSGRDRGVQGTPAEVGRGTRVPAPSRMHRTAEACEGGSGGVADHQVTAERAGGHHGGRRLAQHSACRAGRQRHTKRLTRVSVMVM